MSITVGTQLGSHEITGFLGKGGMGEVYRARDTKLKREVAIKLLPEEFSRDADRVIRFQREAEVLASLNHPNIAGIYDLEETNGARYLVLELVEGETLAERIARGAIPVDEALHIAKSICEALEAAHDKNVVHRDLKPANVKITGDGKVKVLDFGLAKALENAPANPNFSNSPTLSMAATYAGVILGTAAYMSPEQAKGKVVDRRTDIFAFGCVLYEMLTGRAAFDGEDVPDIVSRVLQREPDWTLLPANLSSRLHELLYRCLEKDPKRRWHAVGDIRWEIERLISEPTQKVSSPITAANRRASFWNIAIPALLMSAIVGVVAGVTAWNLKPSDPGMVTRMPIVLPEGQAFTATARQIVAISPDGTKLAYVANEQLFLRHMGEMEARPVPGAGGGVGNPFFSEDGQWIGFHSNIDNSLKKAAVRGGIPITICRCGNSFGVHWSGDDIVYVTNGKGIMRISANGGEPQVLVPIDAREVVHGPQLLDRGRAVMFTVTTGIGAPERWDQGNIVVQSLPAGERKVIVRGGTDARYVPTGHIVYAAKGTVFGVRFDLKNFETRGGPIPLIEGVMRASGVSTSGAAHLSFSQNGTLVYVPGSPDSAPDGRLLALADRTGKIQSLPLPEGPYFFPRLSPNGKYLAVMSDDGKDNIISIYEMSGRSSLRRLAFDGRDSHPVWSPDSRHIFYVSDREGTRNMVRQLADGTGPPEQLTKLETGANPRPESLDPFGKVLTFLNPGGVDADISVLPLGEDAKPEVLVKAESFQGHSVFSPDGRWIAYSSGELTAGRHVFVQPYPSMTAKYQISTEPGSQHPVWSRDGKQIFFEVNSKFFAVDVQTSPTFSFGRPTPLPIDGTLHPATTSRNYDITPDGKHFVVVIPPNRSEANRRTLPQINVVINWFEDVKRRVAVD